MLVLLSPSMNVLPSLDCEGAESQSVGSPVGLLGPYDASRLTASSPGLLLSD